MNILLVQESKQWSAFNIEYDLVAQGNNLMEAKANIKEVLADAFLHDEINIEKAKDMPENFKDYLKDIYGKEYKVIKQFILSDVNINEFIQIKDPSKSERTNVSIKKGYKALAKLRKINISDFLNKALSKELDTEF